MNPNMMVFGEKKNSSIFVSAIIEKWPKLSFLNGDSWGFFFGHSRHESEPIHQILALSYFFPGIFIQRPYYW